jgi:cytidylate kinase
MNLKHILIGEQIMIRVITIDGPACSGKGTLARKLAQELGWFHLDSGLLFRTVGFIFMKHPELPHNQDSLVQLLLNVDFSYDINELKVSYHGENISEELRTEVVGKWASIFAQEPFVRDVLKKMQRQLPEVVGNLVADGRDMGAEVFPDAICKFYVYANLEVRAQRRYLEQRSIDSGVQLKDVAHMLEERDRRDVQREFSPLKKAAEAIDIDTSFDSVEQTLSMMKDCLKKINIIPI